MKKPRISCLSQVRIARDTTIAKYKLNASYVEATWGVLENSVWLGVWGISVEDGLMALAGWPDLVRDL